MLKALKKHRYPYLFISPYILLFLFFQLIPVIWTVQISFNEWDGLRTMKPAGLDNYGLMLQDYMFLDAIRNTLYYWVLSAAGVLLLAIAIASFLNSDNLRAKTFLGQQPFCRMYARQSPWVLFSVCFSRKIPA